jgi:predicted transcriptional regulator
MSLEERTLASLIRRPLVSISCHTSVNVALSIARRQHIHHMPVTRNAALVGLVCTCDLLDAAADSSVECLMHAPVTLDRNASLVDAARAMTQRDVGSVIVTDAGHLSGIVTRGDLLQEDDELAGALNKSRCSCCGLTRHLKLDAGGQTFCIYCLELGADGRRVHID